MKRISINSSAFYLSGILAAAWTIFLFIESLQMRAPGIWRLVQLTIAFVSLFLLIYWLVRHFKPVFYKFHTRQRIGIFLFSIIYALLLLVMIPIETNKFFYVLLPVRELTISVEAGQIDQVKILQFKSSTGEFDPKEISRTSQGLLTWEGKVGDQVVLALKPLDRHLLVRIDWDGLSQSIDLAAATNRNVLFAKQVFETAWFHGFLWILSVWLALTSAVLLGAILLVSASWKPVKARFHWLWYTLPMLTVWMVYLLTFWPGLMSPDSIMQWGEAQSGLFTDAHPAIHTMFIWLLSRLWNTPAVLVIFHIILLSLLTAWGLGELQKLGVAPIVLWGGAVLFALLPINGLLIISVWKDITYALALFAFFIQFVKIAFSNGKWLQNNWNLAGLVLAGLTTAFARHNGLPVILGSLAVLLFIYRYNFCRVLVSTVIFLLIWAGVQGPLYTTLNVKQYPGFGNILFLDHINAHIHAGTALKADEKTFIESLLPLSTWPYNCADSDIRKMDGPIPFDYFAQSTSEPARIAINLFFRSPMVDIEHTLCANSLVWKINTGHYLSVVSLGQNNVGENKWVSENNLGLTERSYFPALIPFLASLVTDKSLFSKPAFYLLVAIFAIAMVALRQPRRKLILIAVPLVLQTSVMLLVNFAQDFRYLYSTVLIALFSLIMLFIPTDLDR